MKREKKALQILCAILLSLPLPILAESQQDQTLESSKGANQSQSFTEWAGESQGNIPCGDSKTADEFYKCGTQGQPDYYILPDGSKCASIDWSGYTGKCLNPIPPDEVKVPVTDVFHKNGQLYKEHWEASKYCHFITGVYLDGYEWFRSQLKDEHALTQLYKYALRANIEGCAK